MAFAQLTYRESLRDIEACLRSLGAKLYHMGFRSQVARSTLADANESRDWRIYADFAQVLIRIARPLYAPRSDRRGSRRKLRDRPAGWSIQPSTSQGSNSGRGGPGEESGPPS